MYRLRRCTVRFRVIPVATDNDFFTVITKLCNSVTEYRYYICVALNLATAIVLQFFPRFSGLAEKKP